MIRGVNLPYLVYNALLIETDLTYLNMQSTCISYGDLCLSSCMQTDRNITYILTYNLSDFWYKIFSSRFLYILSNLSLLKQ